MICMARMLREPRKDQVEPDAHDSGGRDGEMGLTMELARLNRTAGMRVLLDRLVRAQHGRVANGVRVPCERTKT